MLSGIREDVPTVERLAAPIYILKIAACKLAPCGHFYAIGVRKRVYGYPLGLVRVFLEDVCESFPVVSGVMPFRGKDVGRQGGRGCDAAVDLNELRVREQRLGTGMRVEYNCSEVVDIKNQVWRES